MSAKIEKYYDENIEKEMERLSKSFYYSLEKKIVLHLIKKYFPLGTKILDIGGGPGIYSAELLEMDFDVTLIDISRKAMDYASQQFGSHPKFQAFTQDARDLSFLREEKFDCLMNMGPFYHLLDQSDRDKAIKECWRVLKYGGRILAAGISFYGAIRELIARENFEFFLTDEVPSNPKMEGYSYVTPEGHPFVDLYMTRPEPFSAFFEKNGFRTLSMAGSKGFFTNLDSQLNNASEEAQRKIEEITIATCEDADIIGLSNHLFYIAEKYKSVVKGEQWAVTTQSTHFIYRAEVERPWSPSTILQLLEACYREYYEMMGEGLKAWIEVEDRLSPSGKRSARRVNGKIICEFPQGFGNEQHERKLAYHFFAHEVFHHWVGGYTVSHGMAIEAFAQYMANRTLAKLGFAAPYQLIRDRQQREQQIDADASGEIARYYLLFEDLEEQKGEATLYQLCQQLAECFRKAESAGEKADVEPILRSFLNSDIDKLECG